METYNENGNEYFPGFYAGMKITGSAIKELFAPFCEYILIDGASVAKEKISSHIADFTNNDLFIMEKIGDHKNIAFYFIGVNDGKKFHLPGGRLEVITSLIEKTGGEPCRH